MHSLAGIRALNDRAVEKELVARNDALKLRLDRIRPDVFANRPERDRRDLDLWGTLREVEDHIAAKRETKS